MFKKIIAWFQNDTDPEKRKRSRIIIVGIFSIITFIGSVVFFSAFHPLGGRDVLWSFIATAITAVVLAANF